MGPIADSFVPQTGYIEFFKPMLGEFFDVEQDPLGVNSGTRSL